MSQYEKVNDDRCLCCDKLVKKLEAPYPENYDGGVDVLLYPHFGSKHVKHETTKATNSSITVKAMWAVICDECLEGKGITD